MKPIIKRSVLLISALAIIVLGLSLGKMGCVKQGLSRYLFDPTYYVAQYPEVKELGIDPFEHFMKYGATERKNPNKNFDTDFYIKYVMRNDAHMNPLLHYINLILGFKFPITHKNQIIKVNKLLENPKYYVALVAIFRNEGRFLKEWIEFYRMMGVEHFYLYNHLSNDNFRDVLDPYIKAGLVDLYHVDREPKDWTDWDLMQSKVYDDTSRRVADSVEWLMVVDTDEFLFPIKDDNLKTLLKRYDQYASLSVNWKVFGTGNIQHIPNNKLLIETLTRTGDKLTPAVKTIVKPRYVEAFLNPHFAYLKDGYCQITENYEYFVGPFGPRESRNIVRINHYWARDMDHFKRTKLGRIYIKGKRQAGAIEQNKTHSVKYDDTISRFINPLRARVFP